MADERDTSPTERTHTHTHTHSSLGPPSEKHPGTLGLDRMLVTRSAGAYATRLREPSYVLGRTRNRKESLLS
jgi:hypothetical protein